MIIQDRDYEILAALLRYKYLNIEQIHSLFFPGTTSFSSVYSVLKRLNKNGLLELEECRGGSKTRISSIYFITHKGVKCLAGEWKIDPGTLGYKRITNPISSIRQYDHRFEMINFWIELDKDLERFPHLQLKEIRTDAERDENQIPITKISSADKTINVIPDLAIIIEDISSEMPQELLFFIEIDMGTVSIGGRFGNIPERSMANRFLAYETILEEDSWREQYNTSASGFEILTVTTNLEHLDTMRNKARIHLANDSLFYFSTHETIREFGVIRSNSWLRMDDNIWSNVLTG